jgi:hypothetical protein
MAQHPFLAVSASMPSGGRPGKHPTARLGDDELIAGPYRGVAKRGASAYHRW